MEAQEFMGDFEADLTGSSERQKKAYDNMLLDCTLKIGNKVRSEISDKHIVNMPAEDRRLAMLIIRQLSNDFDPVLRFSYEFPLDKQRKEKFQFAVDFTFGVLDFDGTLLPTFEGQKITDEMRSLHYNFKARPYKQQVTDYSEFQYERDLILPRSGQTVRIGINTGGTDTHHSEQKIQLAQEVNSHDFIYKRMPKIVGKDAAGNEQLLKLDCGKLTGFDLEFIRRNILEEEGSLDTLMVIENPRTKKQVTVDLLQIPAFYFPSLGI